MTKEINSIEKSKIEIIFIDINNLKLTTRYLCYEGKRLKHNKTLVANYQFITMNNKPFNKHNNKLFRLLQMLIKI